MLTILGSQIGLLERLSGDSGASGDNPRKDEGRNVKGDTSITSFEMDSAMEVTESTSVPRKRFSTARKSVLADGNATSSNNNREQLSETRMTTRKRKIAVIQEKVEPKKVKLSSPVKKKFVAKKTRNPSTQKKRAPRKKKIEKIFMKEIKCYDYVGMIPHTFSKTQDVLQLPDSDTVDACKTVFYTRNVKEVPVTNKNDKASLIMTLWDRCAVSAKFENWRMIKQAYFKLCVIFSTNYRNEIMDGNLQVALREHFFALLSRKYLSTKEALELVTKYVPSSSMNAEPRDSVNDVMSMESN